MVTDDDDDGDHDEEAEVVATGFDESTSQHLIRDRPINNDARDDPGVSFRRIRSSRPRFTMFAMRILLLRGRGGSGDAMFGYEWFFFEEK